jgi:hypothetical protein
MLKRTVAIAATCLSSVAGCASFGEKVVAEPISPLQYYAYDCELIQMERARVSRRVAEVTGSQNESAAVDAVAMGVGLVLFWPALFLIAGGDHAEELGQLKGEHEALEAAAVVRRCASDPEIARLAEPVDRTVASRAPQPLPRAPAPRS